MYLRMDSIGVLLHDAGLTAHHSLSRACLLPEGMSLPLLQEQLLL